MASNQQTRREVGELAKDTRSGQVGVVMGDIAGRVMLRSLAGGKEWEVEPEKLGSLTPREELSARLTIRNDASRWGN